MACINAATIVAEGSFLNQTASLPSSVIFTASTTGIYRVSTLIQQVTGNSQIYVQGTWTDSVGEITNGTFSVSSDNWYARVAGVYTIQCVANSDITMFSQITSSVTPASYNVLYVIEAI